MLCYKILFPENGTLLPLSTILNGVTPLATARNGGCVKTAITIPQRNTQKIVVPSKRVIARYVGGYLVSHTTLISGAGALLLVIVP